MPRHSTTTIYPSKMTLQEELNEVLKSKEHVIKLPKKMDFIKYDKLLRALEKVSSFDEEEIAHVGIINDNHVIRFKMIEIKDHDAYLNILDKFDAI